MRFLILLMLPMVAACAMSTQLPSYKGRKAFLVECNGMAQSIGACYQKAAELCNGEYDLLVQERAGGSFVISNNQMSGYANPQYAAVSGNGSTIGGSGLERNIRVACR